MTDEQLKLIRDSVRDASGVHSVLVDIEDYLMQIALMAMIVSHYSLEESNPGSNDLQVRMIGRLAEQALKMLEPAEEKLDLASGQIGEILWDIELKPIREQEETLIAHKDSMVTIAKTKGVRRSKLDYNVCFMRIPEPIMKDVQDLLTKFYGHIDDSPREFCCDSGRAVRTARDILKLRKVSDPITKDCLEWVLQQIYSNLDLKL